MCVREEDPLTFLQTPLPLYFCLDAWQWQEMGGNQNKGTPLECMLKNFKKGFNGDYRVKLIATSLELFVN
jgi:hypothetical protein